MTLYELNQLGYAAIPTMSEEDLEKARIKVINSFVVNHASHYYMLLGRDRNYYTIFTFKSQFNADALSKEVIDVIQTLGEIKSIETHEGGDALEIWAKDTEDVAHMYAMFDYSQGVIEIP